MIENVLAEIGLTKGEISVYKALIKLGSSTAGPIIKEAKISPSKIYNIIERLLEKGLVFSGVSPDGRLVEFIELPEHKYFVATQAHPEFKSSLLKPAPLFDGFVKACLGWNSNVVFFGIIRFKYLENLIYLMKNG